MFNLFYCFECQTVRNAACTTCQTHLHVAWGRAKKAEMSVIWNFAASYCDTSKINNMYYIRVILLVQNCFYVRVIQCLNCFYLKQPQTEIFFLPVLCFVSAIAEVDNGDKIMGVNFAADVTLNVTVNVLVNFAVNCTVNFFLFLQQILL